MRATLEHHCIAAGDEQTLVVSATSQVPVQYTSTYADGRSGRETRRGGEYGGAGSGLASDGTMQETWEVSEDAPPGLVVVYVNTLLPGDSALGGPEEALTRLRLAFGLVGAEGECPTEDEPWPESPSEVVTDTEGEHPEVRASLARECVRAGGEQTLRLRAPRGGVAYNSVYANGENGRPRPNGGGYGGAASVAVVAEAVAEIPWTVEEEAPRGHVAVLVQARPSGGGADEAVSLELSYLLVGPDEECP